MPKSTILIFDPSETPGGAFSRAVEMAAYLPKHHYIFLTLKNFKELHKGIEPPSSEKIRLYSFISATQAFELQKNMQSILPSWISPLGRLIPAALYKLNKVAIDLQSIFLLRNKTITVVQSNNGIHITPYKIAHRRKIPIIYYFRDWQFFEHYPRKIIERASKYYFVGSNLMSRYISSLNLDTSLCRVVHSPFDINRRLANEPKDIDISLSQQREQGKKIIICASRICQEKGQHLIIMAAKKLIPKTSSFHIFFMGKNSDLNKDRQYMATLKQLVKSHELESYITFLGHKDNPLHHIQASDISVQAPTYYEALSGALVESVQLGVTTLSADTGGANEIIINGKTGFLFSPENVDELAEQLLFCLNGGDELDQIREYGKHYAKQKWNPEQIKELIDEAYQGH